MVVEFYNVSGEIQDSLSEKLGIFIGHDRTHDLEAL